MLDPSEKSKESDFRVMAAVADMSVTFQNLSRREILEALKMHAVLLDCRVESMFRPIGLSVPSVRLAAEGPRKGSTKTVPKPPKAAWKQDPRWKEAIASHDQAVENVKKANGTNHASLLSHLRNIEGNMKTLKRELKGFRVTL